MANPNENRINTSIAAPDVTAIDGGFTTINTKLDPYTAALTDDERSSLFSTAEENRVFADDALEQGQLLIAAISARAANGGEQHGERHRPEQTA